MWKLLRSVGRKLSIFILFSFNTRSNRTKYHAVKCADMPTFENEKEESKNRGAEGAEWDGVWGGCAPSPENFWISDL